MGWKEMHLRSKPEIPIVTNLALPHLANMLKVGKSDGITYDGSRSPINDGYSFRLNDDFCYLWISPKW